VGEMLTEYRHRRDQTCEWLAAEPRIRFVKPAGAFYLFPDVSDFLSPDGIRTTGQLAQALLDEVRGALTPVTDSSPRHCSTNSASPSRRGRRSTRRDSCASPTRPRSRSSSAAPSAYSRSS